MYLLISHIGFGCEHADRNSDSDHIQKQECVFQFLCWFFFYDGNFLISALKHHLLECKHAYVDMIFAIPQVHYNLTHYVTEIINQIEIEILCRVSLPNKTSNKAK